MTTNSKSYVDPGLGDESVDWIDKVVTDTFEELLAEISIKRKFHKSEEHNRDPLLSVSKYNKIYDDINSYHFFCKFCEQHFYSRSVASDINSFFQKHLNTSYHRQMRSVELPPDDVPIFTWEEKFRTGRCNICQMSALNCYVLQTKLDPAKIMKRHVCIWDKENRENNLKVLRKLTFLKKYCGCKIFRERLLKTVNGRVVCLLCRLKLPWPQGKASCHLISDGHYQNFCVFLQKCFNFAPKDVLNGFNLELVTRSMITRDPPPITEFSDFDERKICFDLSNDNEYPYLEDKDNFGFSPKHVEKLLGKEETDFLHNDRCLLCDVVVELGHLESESHRAKTSFDSTENYLTYNKNRAMRMRIEDCLKSLELGEDDHETPVPPTEKETTEQKTKSPQTNHFKTLLKEKLELVKCTFTDANFREVLCQVCDEYVPVSYEELHLNGPHHKRNEARWEELKEDFKNEKFTEPFQMIRNIIVCLLCGAVIKPNSFYSHIKGEMHKRKFQCYDRMDVPVPISATFAFQKDFSCICTVCNVLLSKRVSFTSLKTTLKNIRYHWPCPRPKDGDTDLKKPEEKTTGIVPGYLTFEKSEGKSQLEGCGMNFEKVEKAVEGIVDVFEKKVLESVFEKSVSLIDRLDDLNLAVEESLNTLGGAQNKSCNDTVSPDSCNASEKEEVKENFEKVFVNELNAQKTENNSEKRAEEEEDEEDEEEEEEDEGEEEEEEKEEKEKFEEEHEVLVIKGLPKRKRTYETVYSKCNAFGKVRYVFFEGRRVKTKTIVAFADRGVAEKVAKETSLFEDNYKVSLKVWTRKAHSKPAEKLPPLHKELVFVLQDPQRLMDFVLNLTVQAVAASESPVERKREELVCSTIISAIFKYFPHSRCYPFGSRLSGLTLNNSDLDVFLDCGGMYEGFKNTTTSTERILVNRIAGHLRKKQEITDIIVVSRARVPIVSFLHKPTLIHCDLSFKNGLSVQNTLLIKFMMSLDWRVRPMILFLKHWAKLIGLHGPPNFSSYAIAMLVIYFLEQLESPVLPTIESLQRSCIGRRTTIGGWDCSINTDLDAIKKTENKDPLPHLLAEFFDFYASFDYDAKIISPLTGTPLPREAFSEAGIAKLPMCYKRHILNIPTPIESLVNKIPICVFDPFDLSHVVTKSFSSPRLQAFTNYCRASAEQMKKGIAAFKNKS